MKRTKGSNRNGFTLIEVLVTVVVIGVLAAVVIPAVTNQVTAGDSSRVLNDINNVRTGIENFDIAVRSFPGDVDDLVNPITTGDNDISGVAFLSNQTSLWAGPYIEATVPQATGSTAGAAFHTGYAASLDNKFIGCALSSASYCDSGATGVPATPDYLTLHIDGLTAAQAQTLNDQIDGIGDPLVTSGKFRYFAASSVGFYYATPIK